MFSNQMLQIKYIIFNWYGNLIMNSNLRKSICNYLSQMVNDDREPDKKPVQQNPQKWLVLGGVVQLFPGIEPSPHS